MGDGDDGQVRPPREPDAAPTGNQLLAVLAALGNPHRLRILAALTERRNYVSRLAREIGIGRPLLHMHLQRLEAAGLVTGSTETGADGRAMKYFEVTPFVHELTPRTIADAARTLTLPTPEPAPEPDGGQTPDAPPRPTTARPTPSGLPQDRARHATSFDAVAADYAAARPTYPPALYDAVEALTGRPLADSDVLDVGAGTGLGTRPLHERGARVTAAEPGPGMAAQFRAGLPGVPLVRANGNRLPFAAASFDLVTYAQAWHWTDPERSVPEALRVLRPTGALALWWNVPDPDDPWRTAQAQRLQAGLPAYHGHNVSALAADIIAGLGLPVTVHRRDIPWERTVPLATHLANLASHSSLSVSPPEVRDRLLAAERDAAAHAFPDGRVTERYHVRLTLVARTPDAAGPGGGAVRG